MFDLTDFLGLNKCTDYLHAIQKKNTCICYKLGKKPITKLSDPISRGIQSPRFANKAHIVTFRKDGKNKKLYYGYDKNGSKTYLEQAFVDCVEIGHGSFGTVHSAIYLEDGKRYAIKKSHNLYTGEKNRTAMLHEVKIQELLPPNDHIVQFFKAWEESDRLYIQLELCGSYSLFDIKTCDACVNSESLWIWLKDMTKAVKFLHDLEIIHLDVKPDNMFITSNGHCKLGDFGLALDLNVDNVNDYDDGDSRYLAPEILNNSPTKAADVYSLGMSFIHLSVDNKILPKSDEFKEICYSLKDSVSTMRTKYFKRVKDDRFLTILSAMIDIDPLERPELAEILNRLNKKKKNKFYGYSFIIFICALFCIFTFEMFPKFLSLF